MSTFDSPEKVRLGRCKLIEETMIGEDKVGGATVWGGGTGQLGEGGVAWEDQDHDHDWILLLKCGRTCRSTEQINTGPCFHYH